MITDIDITAIPTPRYAAPVRLFSADAVILLPLPLITCQLAAIRRFHAASAATPRRC